MPDINPADLSRPAASLSTPTLSSKTITVSTPSTNPKPIKTSQIIPARIELEPLYAALKSAIGAEQWATYKDASTQFFIGSYLANNCIRAIAHLLTPSPRSIKPNRVLRTHRPHHHVPQWREGASTQPAPRCTLCQCHS